MHDVEGNTFGSDGMKEREKGKGRKEDGGDD